MKRSRAFDDLTELDISGSKHTGCRSPIRRKFACAGASSDEAVGLPINLLMFQDDKVEEISMIQRGFVGMTIRDALTTFPQLLMPVDISTMTKKFTSAKVLERTQDILHRGILHRRLNCLLKT